jgi:hypothetical protein
MKILSNPNLLAFGCGLALFALGLGLAWFPLAFIGAGAVLMSVALFGGGPRP